MKGIFSFITKVSTVSSQRDKQRGVASNVYWWFRKIIFHLKNFRRIFISIRAAERSQVRKIWKSTYSGFLVKILCPLFTISQISRFADIFAREMKPWKTKLLQKLSLLGIDDFWGWIQLLLPFDHAFWDEISATAGYSTEFVDWISFDGMTNLRGTWKSSEISVHVRYCLKNVNWSKHL